MSYSALYYFLCDMSRFFSRGDMVSVRRIRRWETNLWVFRNGGKSTNRVYRSNIDGIWKCIMSIAGYFVWSETISDGMGGRFKDGLPKSTGNSLLKKS